MTQYITLAYTSRLEPTAQQRNMFIEWAGVRKFAYNDALWRTEDKYARKILASKKPCKSIFDLRRVAKLLGLETKYVEENGEWIFTLTDTISGNSFQLIPSIHGAVGKHVNPEKGLEWIKALNKALPQEPPSNDAALRARYPWIEKAPAVVYREACADAEDSFKRFWNPPIGMKIGYPHRDDGSRKRFRMEPGGAKALKEDGEMSEKVSDAYVLGNTESDEDAILRLGGDYVEGAGKKHDGPKHVYLNTTIKVKRNAISFPGLDGGWVKLSHKGYLPTGNAKFSQVALYERGGYWHVSLTARIPAPKQKAISGKTIGIDLGHRHLMVDSDGKIFGGHRDLKEEQRLQKRIDRLGRKLTRQVGTIALTKRTESEKGGAVIFEANPKTGKKRAKKQKPSKGWKKTKLALAHAHKKLADIRNDLRHQATSREIRKNASVYSMENIGVQEMLMKTMDATAHDKRLRKINAAIGYYEIRRQMEYKAKWNGAEVKTHEPYYTSKQCPECGNIDFKMGSREYHRCENCGFGITHGTEVPKGADLPRHHRDFAAAITHSNPEKHQEIRDSAWASRHMKKGSAGSGLPDSNVEMGGAHTNSVGKASLRASSKKGTKKGATRHRRGEKSGSSQGLSVEETPLPMNGSDHSDAVHIDYDLQQPFANTDATSRGSDSDFNDLQSGDDIGARAARKPPDNMANLLGSGESGCKP